MRSQPEGLACGGKSCNSWGAVAHVLPAVPLSVGPSGRRFFEKRAVDCRTQILQTLPVPLLPLVQLINMRGAYVLGRLSVEPSVAQTILNSGRTVLCALTLCLSEAMLLSIAEILGNVMRLSPQALHLSRAFLCV